MQMFIIGNVSSCTFAHFKSNLMLIKVILNVDFGSVNCHIPLQNWTWILVTHDKSHIQ